MAKRKRNIPQAPVELLITGLSHEGRGIARHNDKIIFVFGALPGEKVLAQYTQCYARYDEATAIEIIEPSKERVTPPCAHFGVCGGCQLQHLEPHAQITYKQAFLKEHLVDQAKVNPKTWLPPLTGNFLGYRQKARLGVRYVIKKEALLVGFREQKNNKIALTESCSILYPPVGEHIHALREMITTLEGRDNIAQIEIAVGNQEVALVFRHLKALSEQDIAQLKDFCSAHNFILYLQPDGIDSVHRIYPANDPLLLQYTLSDQNLTYAFHPCDFTQVNHEMNQKMVNLALELLAPQANDVILDLFCGLGNFSLPLAQKAKQVVGVEGAVSMVKRAQQNAQANHLENVAFYDANLESDFADAPWLQQSFNKILLDPPRSGAQNIVEKINQFKAKEILYISCNPATFARDAGVLVHQHGYVLEKVGVMDMFPHTAHVETIGLFIQP